MGRIFEIESASVWQHKAEETIAQQLIDSINNCVGAIEWKTELIMGELLQVHKDLINQEAETCTPQLQFLKNFLQICTPQLQYLKNSLQIVEQKTDLILEELQLLRAGPQDFTTPELTLEGIKQFYVSVDSEQWKKATLCDLQKNLLINKNVVVFVNAQDKAKWLTDVLRDQNNIPALTIYGDMEQHTREDIMRQFRSGSSPMLISTDDILAPGLDIHYLQVSLVINYDLPMSPEKYLSRVGQSAWLKRKGFAINFTTSDDEKMLLDIQSFYNVAMEELPARVDDLIYDI